MMRTRWIPGPERRGEDPVVVALTAFRLHRAVHLPRACRTGWGLSRLWPELDGAVGLWLWADPGARRIGSVSVWRSEAGLRAFVRLPAHVAIMRAYRDRGELVSVTWTSTAQDLWEEARSHGVENSAPRG
ncbi:hypothetical protein [Nonomuraea africana]|uniref:Heme-degrading monooxygenase HmoA n=1 Tax=Nonomuraea africana TaxID=46171 RepID=A0ABR9KGL1_9ACTN|nr:hypothetical protein [Nonomuraea africana]MBE1561155.1 heme-degrading monooxygenase HmoA [Nonomuraea africana]